jgi:hypothetical protein
VFYKDDNRYLPLYVARMFHHFNHRFRDFSMLQQGKQGHNLPDVPVSLLKDPSWVPMPRYWVREDEVDARLHRRWSHDWLIGFRNVCRNTDERTMLTGVMPKTGVGHSVPLILPSRGATEDFLLESNLASFVFDYVLRQKLGGTNLTFGYLSQIPVPSPDAYGYLAPWDRGALLREWLPPRALELTYTAWDLEPFALDLGYDGPPFRWDRERRFLLRCELDAAFFHLYGIGCDDADYIMETFPIVKRKDEAAHGEYRTKRVILEIYDQMARATETGQPYQTLLDPPPVELDLAASDPATVTPLRPREDRPYLRPEVSRPAPIAAEEKAPYGADVKKVGAKPIPEQPQNLADTRPGSEDSSQPLPKHRGGVDEPDPDQRSGTPPEATLFSDNEVEANNTLPSIEEAALALHACVPEGEKVQREKLLLDAARELGYTKLTKRIRRSLNKGLNAEHNKKRLKTDWQLVWKPKRK